MTSIIYANSVEQFEPRGRQLIAFHPMDDGTVDDDIASCLSSNIPKCPAKYNSYENSTSPNNDEIWAIREVYNGEEQLYAKCRCVYWTRNSLIIKTFNFTDRVIRVLWCSFDKIDHMCIALASGLSIFDHQGRHYQMLLPFSYKDVYATSVGLIIERNCDTFGNETSLPMLFALTHPTREVSPVIFKPATRTAQHNRILTYALTNFTSIVSCHATLPLCLMYNSQDCQHSLWRIRPTTNDELDEFNQMNENSNNTTTNTFSQSNYSFRTPDAFSHSSLNISNKQKSSLIQNSSASTLNYSPKLDYKSRHSALGNLAASRLGAGYTQMAAEPTNTTTNLRSFKESLQTFNTVSTPNRNRIINYLRDNIDEPILPELTVEQIWTESTNNSLKAVKFFTTSDLAGDHYMVIVMPAASQVKIMRYDKSILESNHNLSILRCICIQATDAAPVDKLKMMLVMDTTKNLVLYSGFDRVTSVSIMAPSSGLLRSMPTSSPANMKNSPNIEVSPIQASSARKRISMGERSSIGSDMSLHQIFQTLSPVPHASKYDIKNSSSPVCQSESKKIEYVIGQTVYLLGADNQRVRVEIPARCQTGYVDKLLNSMKALVSRDLGLHIVTSWYQTRRASNQPDLMQAHNELNLFKNWFLSCLGVEQEYFGNASGPAQLEISVKIPNVSPTKRSRRLRDNGNPFLTNINTLFYSIHLVFEDLSIKPLNYAVAYSIAELLMILACILKHREYQSYYWSKFPQLQDSYGPQRSHLEGLIPRVKSIYMPPFFAKEPPGLMDFLTKIVALSQMNDIALEDEPIIPFPNIPQVTDDISTLVSLFCTMFAIDIKDTLINLSPTTPRPNQIILKSRPSRSERCDKALVEMVIDLGKDRNYLSCLPSGINLFIWEAILNCRESPPSNWSEACYNLIGRMDLVNLICDHSKISRDGEDETLKLLFPDDIRVSEAQRMVSSDSPVEFSITTRQGATEDESREETHRHLYLLNVRTMAMPIGRGAISLRTYSPVIGESFEVPRLELTGRSMNEERPIEYSHDVSVYPWPFFHNGVAAGLTICASTANNIIDSTWINYNRPRSNILYDARDRDSTAVNINNEHAGFLFALGLNGHLEKLSLMALHDYLCQNNDLTKLAILLGMSAAKRGTRDTNIIKVLSIHVDALLPPDSTELDVSAPVHAASIIGVGLLYQNSGDSHISRVLIEEIGRLPGPEANSHIDRESYSLSAGLAFGLVNLCRGGSTTISSSDQLRLYMLGGRRKPLTAAQKQRYHRQDCHLGEEEYINTHITSPGGTLGLGLMYHRSQNASVANWMRAPDTQTLLEYVRPDFLVLRMLSYGLIMWDTIEPSEAYINSHIPAIVADHAFRLKFSSNGQLCEPFFDAVGIDYELISQAYCNIVAGCCMSIAMRYAGTANTDAYKTIYKHTKMLIALCVKPALVEQAGRPCVEACLNVLVTSLAVVMAGTGDLGVMRICRYLRSRLTQNCVFYGSHMAIHMALGILFLGSCRYSLSTSPEAIGALVCALYPIYPNHSSDNRYHLQALRHLYVLAAEPRLLIPRDILTNKPVYVKIVIKQSAPGNDSRELKLTLPCLIPEVETIQKIYLDDDRYWHIEINDKKVLMKCLHQERGYLSVKQKSHSSNNQLVKNIETYILQNIKDGRDKNLKSNGLNECVQGDRVEQFSALNKLLNDTKKADKKYFCLVLEQLFIARMLDKNASLQPVFDRIADELSANNADEDWMRYLEDNDWTKTNMSVAQYIAMNNLRFCEGVANTTIMRNSDHWLSFFI